MNCDIEAEILAAIDRASTQVDDTPNLKDIPEIVQKVYSNLPKWVHSSTKINVEFGDIGKTLGFGLRSKYVGNITIMLPNCFHIEREFFYNDDIVYGVYVVDGNVTNNLDAAIFEARSAFWEERNQEAYAS